MPRIAKILAAAFAAFCAAFASADTFVLADYVHTDHFKNGHEAISHDAGVSSHFFGDVFYGGMSVVTANEPQVAFRVGATSGVFTPYVSYSEIVFKSTGERLTTHVVDFGLFYEIDEAFRFNFTRSASNEERVNFGIGFLGSLNATALSMQLNSKRGFSIGVGRRF